jgi:hypothetical protein
MALMMSRLDDGLRKCGADDDKARAAAAAGNKNRLSSVKSKLGLLTCLVGTNIVVTPAVFGVLLRR